MNFMFMDNICIDVEYDNQISAAFMNFILRKYYETPGARTLDGAAFIAGFTELVESCKYMVAVVRQDREAIAALKSPRPASDKSRLFGRVLDYYYKRLSGFYVTYPAVSEHITFFILCLPVSKKPQVPRYFAEYAELERHIEEIQGAMEEDQCPAYQIMFSDAVDEIKDIPWAFHQSLFSCDYLFNLFPERRYITPLLLTRHTPDSPFAAPPAEVERLYFESVIKRDFGLCERTLRQIIYESVKSLVAVLSARPLLTSRLEWTLALTGVPGSLNDHAGYELHGLCNRVNLCKTLEELTDLITFFFQRLEIYCRKAPQTTVNKIEMIVDFIRRNYADPSLNVNFICESFNLSPEHLSRMFKKKTGIKIVDYIHITRLDGAKKLIADTDMSFTDISRRVGYTGEWSLARALKRFENATPSAYREAAKKSRTG